MAALTLSPGCNVFRPAHSVTRSGPPAPATSSPAAPTPAPPLETFHITSPSPVTADARGRITWSAAEHAARYVVSLGGPAGCDVSPLWRRSAQSAEAVSLPQLDDGRYTICVVAFDADGTAQAADNNGYEFTLDTIPPVAALADAPSSPSTAAQLRLTVGGEGVQTYRYALLDRAEACSSSTALSDWVPASTPLTASLTTTGIKTLCLAGRDAAGNVQPTMTQHQWRFTGNVPPLSLDVGDVDFGPLLVGTTVFRTVTVANTRAQPVTDVVPDLSGSGPTFKGGTYPGTGGTCGTVVAASCTMVFEFTPAQVAAYQSLLTLRATADGQSVTAATLALSGKGLLVLGQDDLTTNANLGLGGQSPSAAMIQGTQLIVADNGNNRVLIWHSVPAANAPPDVVLGQPDLYTNTANTLGLSAKSLSGPSAAFSDGVRLVVADYFNHRVLIWSHTPTANFTPADLVLGQTSFTTGVDNLNGVSARSLNNPFSVWTDGVQLIVADRMNHRVLIWNTFPTAIDQAADVVLGQPDMTSNQANNGGLSARSLWEPLSVSVGGGKLFVADFRNNRVLVWNSVPATNFAPADLVVGQANLTDGTANSGGVSAKSLSTPISTYSDGTRLYVSDYGNHRVLAWNTLPVSDFAPADFVLGQPSVTANTADNGGVSAAAMANPSGVHSDGTRLVVADTANHRVLVWNTLPTATGQPADLVLLQPSATVNAPNTPALGSGTLKTPAGLATDGTRLAVADSTSNRVLLWNSWPHAPHAPADTALGQPDLNGTTANSGGLGAAVLNRPMGVAFAAGGLFVNDYNNHRILGWSSVPVATGTAAAFALGQPNMTTNAANSGGLSAASLNAPRRSASDGTRFYAADEGNHRVLVWNSIPASTQTPADLVLGQQVLTATSVNGGIGGDTLSGAIDAAFDGTHLIAADWNNNRVLIWNQLPTDSGQPADLVLGQPGMATAVANNGGLSAHSLSHPHAIFSTGTALFVVDNGNNRVLVWTAFPTANNASADLVLGQLDFTSNAANNGGIGPATLSSPTGAAVAGGKLFITDNGNHRVLIWNSVPSVSHAAADVVLGQASMTANTANAGGLSAQTLANPTTALVVGNALFVSDRSNNRVLRWNSVPMSNHAPADAVLGQASMTTATPSVGAGALRLPHGLASDGSRLFVADRNNHRILVWNTLPAASGASADFVLGQSSFYASAADSGGVSPSSLYEPAGLAIVGSHLFAADFNNHRIAVWNSLPNATGTPADLFLGHTSAWSSTANDPGAKPTSLNHPTAIYADGARLYVADYGNNRVLVWNSPPTSNQQPPDAVIGQPDFRSVSPALGVVDARSLNGPSGLASDGRRLYVTDRNNHRVLGFPLPIEQSYPAADIVLGQDTPSGHAAGIGPNHLNTPEDILVHDGQLAVSDAGNSRIVLMPLPP